MNVSPLERLRYHVTGAIERGEGVAIVEKPAAAAWNHTPGPWNWTEYNDTRAIHSADGTKIALPEVWIGNAAEESEANARLIAAAPDMLETLEEIRDFWVGGDVPAELEAKMIAVIEKARGAQ